MKFKIGDVVQVTTDKWPNGDCFKGSIHTVSGFHKKKQIEARGKFCTWIFHKKDIELYTPPKPRRRIRIR